MNRTPMEIVLDSVQRVTGQEPQKSGADWKCCCPAHDDRNPSLSVSEADDGRVLIHCLAGCRLDDVLNAAKLEKRDLFPQSSEFPSTVGSGTSRSVEATRGDTRRDGKNRPKPSRSWPKSGDAIAVLERKLGPRSFAWTYRDENEQPLGMVIRWDREDGTKKIRPLRSTADGWQIGAMPEPRPLFRLPDIMAAGTVFVVEGEMAALAAESIGLPVTTSSGGSKAAAKTDWSPLSGKHVVIIPDNDEPGAKYAVTVAGIVSRLDPPATVRVLDLEDDWPDLPDKGDLADFCEAHDSVEPETLRERIEALADRTEPLSLPDIPESSTVRTTKRRAMLQRFSEIEPESLRWLWSGRIPSGMLTVVSGNPGEGKSMVLTDIVARVTKGSDWPDDSLADEPGDVVMINVEDSVAAVQRPRLDAAGADVDRVRRINGVELPQGDQIVEERSFSIMDAADVLRSALEQLDQPRLIVLDPLAAFLAGVRSNDQGDIRAAFSPLVQLAEEFDVAIVFVHHNRKGSGSHASERLSGSLQIGATVRQSWEVVVDPDDAKRRLFLPGKNSNAKDRGGLAFQIVDSRIRQSEDDDFGDFVGRVEWQDGIVDLTADQAARFEPDDESRDPWPVEWLRDFLSTGAKNAGEVSRAAKADGLTEKQVRTSKRRLKVKVRKSDFRGGWIWELPEQPVDQSSSANGSTAAPEAA